MVSSKNGPSSGSGLSNKREHAKSAVGENAFERELAAFDEGFHLQKAILAPRDPFESAEMLR